MRQIVEPTSIYSRLGALLANAPDLRAVDEHSQVMPSTLQWLGRVAALGEQLPDGFLDDTELRLAIDALVRHRGMQGTAARVSMAVHKIFARAELYAPAAVVGNFINSGAPLDAIASLSKILSSIKQFALIIDPYMGARAVTDVASLAPEGSQIALLTDEATMKPGLKPAALAWIEQYGRKRPLTLRAAPARSLHDRLILIDSDDAWILTQSIEHFAARSPATIQKTDAETAKLKFAAYGQLWNAATLIATTPD